MRRGNSIFFASTKAPLEESEVKNLVSLIKKRHQDDSKTMFVKFLIVEDNSKKCFLNCLFLFTGTKENQNVKEGVELSQFEWKRGDWKEKAKIEQYLTVEVSGKVEGFLVKDSDFI